MGWIVKELHPSIILPSSVVQTYTFPLSKKCVFHDNAQNLDMVVVHEKSLQNVQNYPLFEISKQSQFGF